MLEDFEAPANLSLAKEMARRTAGFVGNNFLYQLEMCKRKLAQTDCRVIPQAATLYCMGLQTLTPAPGGFDFSSLDKFRHSPLYSLLLPSCSGSAHPTEGQPWLADLNQ